MKQRRWFVFFVLLGMLAVASCGDDSGSSSSPDGATGTEDGEPREGGTLVIGQVAPVRSLDPAAVSISNGELDALYGRLVGYDRDSRSFVGRFAQEWSSNDDFSVWTVKLRDRINFTDGTPYNADAVVMNMERFADPQRRSPAYGWMSTWVDSMRAVDDLTIEFTLKRPFAGFHTVLANYPTYIAAPSYLKALDGGDQNATPIGAGAFKLDKFLPGDEISFVRNDDYVDGPPHLDGLKFVYIPGGPATYETFQSGGIHVGLVNDRPTVSKATEDGVPIATNFSNIYNTLLLNNRPQSDPAGSVLSDERLRKAIAYAFDITVWNDRVNLGLGDDTNVLFPESSQLFSDGSQWFDDAMEPHPYDPDEAKKLVDEVKAETGWDGTIKFVCSNNPQQANMPIAVKAMLEPVGFHVEVENSLDQGALINSVIVNPDYDAACWGMSIPDHDPVPYLYNYLYTGGFNNFGQFSDPAMDKVLDQLREASGPDEIREALVEFHRVWNETIPSVNAGSGTWAIFHTEDLKGVEYNTVGGDFSAAWLSS